MASFLTVFNGVTAEQFLFDKKAQIVEQLVSEWESMKSILSREDVEQEDGNAGIDVQLRLRGDWSWKLLTGDSQYDTDHNGYWGSQFLNYDLDESIIEETMSGVADNLINQVLDDMWM